ncbi:MAG: SAM-dependent methyltransferase [Longispora sp.]|nr:SAM-dependent methyltransferase [Longispora sp. (in: high G+C Gram-positive bacteria)]
MSHALYGPEGYFRKNAPATQFRTSVHASPLFAAAIATLVTRLDAALGHPPRLDIVDIGAGRGELLTALAELLPARLKLIAVEVDDRPADLAQEIDWVHTVPPNTTGLLIATEWLDNVPIDVVCRDTDGVIRLVNTDHTLGPPADPDTVAWLNTWWPEFTHAEPGAPRDAAWRAAVAGHTGLALAVDYGHTRHNRPSLGTLTGYRNGRQVPPRPDGSTDITAHVAMDSLTEDADSSVLLRQRDALTALGVSGARPSLTLASTDPRRYVNELSRASQAAELTDPSGLGGHWWLLQGVGVDVGRFWGE